MQDPRTNHLIEMGMVAYRSRLYDAAVERLQKASEWDPQDWTTQLYLALSHLKAKQYDQASSAFLHIYMGCPNHDLREKAWEAMELIKHRQARTSEYSIIRSH